MTEKANIIKDHLWESHSKLTIVANIGPTMATFKLYDLSEEDSLKLHITLSNLGDIDEQIHQLWQQVNFLLKQYCSHCRWQKEDDSNNTWLHKYSNQPILKTVYHIQVLCNP